jgi:hypothetical protein
MSIVLFLVFLLGIVVLGFGLNGWSVAGIILLLTAGLSFLMTGIDIQATKENWDKKRCDFDTMLLGFLYKPSDDPRGVTAFATENFQFCVGKSFQDLLLVLLSPLLAVVSREFQVLNGLQDVFKGIRQSRGTMVRGFEKLFEPIWQRFFRVGMMFSQNYQRLASAFERVSGIAIATAYMGIGVNVILNNFISFVIKVVLTVLGIIVALFAILFVPLLPLLGFLAKTVSDLDAAGFGDFLPKGARRVFCFDPETPIRLQSGFTKPIKELVLGDCLEDGGCIEGILETDGQGEDLFTLRGILVSGTHLVWSDAKQEWVSVRDHEDARQTTCRRSRLLCFRTSTRTIPIRDWRGKQYVFRDWEELPPSLISDKVWDFLVSEILNSSALQTPPPSDDPLLGTQCRVRLQTGEQLPIEKIQIGDTIYSESGFTKVLAVYRGLATLPSNTSFSDGVWLRKQSEHPWTHPLQQEGILQQGVHLVTDSGTIWIQTDNYSGFLRDFTEVGIDQLELTYPYMKALLKKSSSKEEQCVPDSS